jgi:phosphate transport system permease protein
MARAVGETAPLIMTSFGTQTMNANPFSGPQQSLPLFVWQQYQLGGGAVGTPSFLRAFTGAFALIMVVLVLFVIARLVGRSKFTAR